MPEMPNIQLEILKWVNEHADEAYDSVNLREFAAQSEYTENRVAKKAADTGVLGWGTSVMYPWYKDKEDLTERIDELSN